jgi:hypothetical protein
MKHLSPSKRRPEDGAAARHPIWKICAGAQVFQQIEMMNIEKDGEDSRFAAERGSDQENGQGHGGIPVEAPAERGERNESPRSRAQKLWLTPNA